MTDLAALAARIQALAGSSCSRAEANRARAPEFAAFVDDYKRVFNARVAWIRWEDGSEQGKRQPGPGVVPFIPPKRKGRRHAS